MGPKYQIGLKIFDDEHKKLADLINKLYTAFGSNNNNRIIGEVLSELIDYTIYHFGNEEKLFVKFGYTAQIEHVNQHQKFVDKITEFQNNFENDSVTVSIDLLNFLKDWLVNHILKTDAKYVPFLKEKGLS